MQKELVDQASAVSVVRQGLAADPSERGGSLSLLKMSAAGAQLAVSIEHVREILQVSLLTPVPRTPPFVRGVMNRRGVVVPVLDLGYMLNLSVTVLGKRTCIVVVENVAVDESTESAQATGAIGLLVDTVYEVFDCSAADVEVTPVFGTEINALFMTGLARSHGHAIPVLNLSQILACTQLREAVASFKLH
jgi:purine-binding chemotaxis protein CheW